MSRSSNAPATPVSNPASAQGVETITARYTNWRGETAERTFIPHRVFFGSTEWHPEPQVLIEATDCGKGALRTFAASGFASPAPSRDAAVPASGGVRESAPYGIIDPDYARIFTIARCSAWSQGYALLMNGSFTRDLDLLAVPWTDCATDPEHLVRRIVGVLDELDLLVKDPDARSQASEKPHGRLAWTLTFKAFGDPRFVDLSVMPRTALSSAPATPSPAEAEALPAGVDVHEEWQRRLKRNDFSDDDWSEWKACDERQVRDIQTLGHPSGFPFLNAEVRRVRITTAALSASAPAPEERADG